MNEEQMMMVLDTVEEIKNETMAEIAALRAEYTATTSPDDGEEE